YSLNTPTRRTDANGLRSLGSFYNVYSRGRWGDDIKATHQTALIKVSLDFGTLDVPLSRTLEDALGLGPCPIYVQASYTVEASHPTTRIQGADNFVLYEFQNSIPTRPSSPLNPLDWSGVPDRPNYYYGTLGGGVTLGWLKNDDTGSYAGL